MNERRKNTYVVWQRAVMLAVVLGLTLVVAWRAQTASNNDFTPYPGNPLMELGDPGEWDAGTILLIDVVEAQGEYHLFYTGLAEAFTFPAAIGYASSDDGLTWTRYANNPVFTASDSGFDSYAVAEPVVLYEDDVWIMYYSGKANAVPTPDDFDIGRATAPNPWGPWTRDTTPVLTRGGAGEWDSGFVEASSVVKVDEQYVMYYSGGVDFFSGTDFMVGMATSPDGVTWTKYDDPTTTAAPFAESDPVLMPGTAGSWDEAMAWLPEVRYTVCGWEMYFSGSADLFGAAIGYAESADGITWTKDANNPIFTSADDPAAPGPVVEGATVIDIGAERWMYYDYGQGTDPASVGLATAPVACTPTAVEMASLSTTVNADGSVTVLWTTAAETGNAGFNVYRSDSAETTGTALNSALIASTATAGAGAEYSFVDTAVGSGTFYYWVEAVSVDGVAELHGPVETVAQTPTSAELTGFAGSNDNTIIALLLVVGLVAGSLLVLNRNSAHHP